MPHGLEPRLADRGLLAGAEAYERSLDRAVAAGGFAFHVTGDGARFWAQDRRDALDRHFGAG